MSTPPVFDSQKVNEAVAAIGKALTGATSVLVAQGALGWSLQDEPEKARQNLARLTSEQRAKVADAADLLAKLAREEPS